jgi:hypothetical protein
MNCTGSDSLPPPWAVGKRMRQALNRLRAGVVWLATRSEDTARRAPLRFSLLVTAGLFAMVFVSLAPSFQSNDDPQMAMIAAGKGACLKPDEHLIFTNVIVGQILKVLYVACPSIPWYGAYLYLVQYLAQVAILYCTISQCYTRLRMRLYLMFFASVGLFLLNNLQFTTTASLAGQGGILLCLLTLQTSMPKRRVWQLLGSGVALLVLVSLIRLECFYLTLLVALPTAVCLNGLPGRRSVLIAGATTAGVCLALVLGFAAYNDAYYEREPAWRSFLSYNKLRIIFNDYGWTSYTPQTAHLFAAVNWTKNDYDMIANWYYDDPVLFSEARLRQVLDSYPWRGQRLTVDYCWSCARTFLGDRSLWSIVLIFPLFFWCADRSRRNVLAFLASLVAGATVLGGILVFDKLPPSRIYFPVLTFPLALLLLITRDTLTVPRLRWPALTLRCLASPRCWRRRTARVLSRPLLIHALVITGVLGFAYGITRQYRRSYAMQSARHDLLKSIAAAQPRDDELYVMWAPGFPYQALSPFDNLMSFSNVHQLVMGWPQFTPIYQAMKQQFGIDNVSRALYERSNVILVGEPKCHALFQRYIQEHHGVDVRFVIRYAGGHPYDVFGHFEPRTGSGYRLTADHPAVGPKR